MFPKLLQGHFTGNVLGTLPADGLVDMCTIWLPQHKPLVVVMVPRNDPHELP
jgi:hypothetical protein